MVPPPNPRGTGSLPGWCHQPPRMVPPVSSPTAGSPKQCHPSVRCAAKLVLPVSPEGPTGATRDPAHQLVPPVGSSPAGSARKPETVPPASSTASCASSRCHSSAVGATPQFRDRQPGTKMGPPVISVPPAQNPPSWCHPSDCRKPTGSQLVPPVGLSPAGSARKPETVPRPSSSPARCKLGATPQSGGRKWRRCCGPLRPELLPFARSCRLWGFTHRR